MVASLDSGLHAVRVGAGQFEAGDLEHAGAALDAIDRLIHAAAEQGVELLVLPECAYPAYLLGSPDRYRAADVLSTDEFLVFLARRARRRSLTVACGYVDDRRTALYNAAVLIDPGGQILGRYFKSFLWGADNTTFEPGERAEQVTTPLGTVGMIICADARAPELVAAHASGGAQVIAMPTCWVNVARAAGAYENPQPEYLIAARSREFAMPFVCANKYGMETERLGYCGRSLITDHTGRVLAEAPGCGETLIVADLTLPPCAPRTIPGLDEILATPSPGAAAPRPGSTVSVTLVPPGVGAPRDAGDALVLCCADQGPPAALDRGSLDRLHDLPCGRVGCVSGATNRSFVSARRWALQGMDLLAVLDADADVPLLRARAIENRTFVAAVGPAGAWLISPGGVIVAHGAATTLTTASAALSEASDKQVAPGTDIWEQRRPRSYRN